MNEFIQYIKLGLNHVLDLEGYDHILFLIVLAIIYQFKEWRKVVWLVSLFTIGHSITLALSAYGVVKVNASIVEFLIPVTIAITALLNIFTAKKSVINSNRNLFFALAFGFIHGLGFSNYFKMLISKSEDKLLPLLEFAIGIELAQIIIVLGILLIGYIVLKVLNVRRNIWVIVISAIVFGVSLKMIFERVFW